MIEQASYIEKYKINVVFSDNTTKDIDLKKFLFESKNPHIKKYRDLELFKQFYLDYGTLCWGDNEFDISPFSIYDGDFDIKKPAKKAKIKQNK